MIAPDDRQAVTDLIHRFYWLVDHGRAAETAGLFSASAQITFGPGSPSPGTVEGDAIPGAMRHRGAQTHITTRHVLSNIALSANPDGSITGYSLLTLFRSETGTLDTTPAAVADVDEIFVRAGDGWRIARRLITPIFTCG